MEIWGIAPQVILGIKAGDTAKQTILVGVKNPQEGGG